MSATAAYDDRVTPVAVVVPDCAGSKLLGRALARHLNDEAADVRVFTDSPASSGELIERIRGAHTVLHYFRARHLDAKVLARARPARVVVMGPVGDSVDTIAAKAHGISVYDTPGLAAAAVAEFTLGLILGLARHIPPAETIVRTGGWEPCFGRELAGRRLGVVGLGRIGRRVADAALALGMHVAAWSRGADQGDATAGGIAPIALDELLRTSDVVTLHLRLSPNTTGLIDRRRLGLLKSDALLINTARAELVDTEALRTALAAGKLGGAALDVFESEPLARGDPLRASPTVLPTPHMAWMTVETIERFVAAATAFACEGDRTHVAQVV
jgi:phosphoglycerate dehydrogenase-like enzyme